MIIQNGKYSISIDKLFEGWTPDNTSGESTLIRQYIEFKKQNKLPKKYSVDQLMEICYFSGDIVWFCLMLLENAIRKIDTVDIYTLDLDKLIEVKSNEDELHKFLLSYFSDVQILD